ncbi:MAG: ABC transporter ATP-binding protein [Spirochaetaceae bacterium]|nr:MAG: ABC transporter ATP-binding protein [Spirochaetaceae bacterium]
MKVLDVQSLVVFYGKINALKGVSLSVEQGQFVTLIGANGAGKTTLLNTVTGVVEGTEGSVRYHGKEILNRYPHDIVRLGIAHVPEGRKIFPELTVEENMRIGAFIMKDRTRVQALLDRNYELFPRLAERRRQEGGTLSGGEQQMLAIARGLMSDPELILLDEPSLGLAPLLVEKIFEFIVEINRLGKSILLVEQNANLALQVAHYGYVMETGRVVREDSTDRLRSDDAIKNAYLGIG